MSYFQVIVKDIPPTMDANFIGNFLSSAGPVLEVVCNNGLALVTFISEEAANNAIQMYNYYKFNDTPIRIIKNDPETQNLIQSQKGLLIIKGLDSNVQLSEINGFFSQVGEIITCQLLPTDWGSFGFAFIQYRNPSDADKAKTMFNGYLVNGKPITIELFSPEAKTIGDIQIVAPSKTQTVRSANKILIEKEKDSNNNQYLQNIQQNSEINKQTNEIKDDKQGNEKKTLDQLSTQELVKIAGQMPLPSENLIKMNKKIEQEKKEKKEKIKQIHAQQHQQQQQQMIIQEQPQMMYSMDMYQQDQMQPQYDPMSPMQYSLMQQQQYGYQSPMSPMQLQQLPPNLTSTIPSHSNTNQSIQQEQIKKTKPKEEKPLIETPNMPSLYPSMPLIEETGILIRDLPEEYRDSEAFNRLVANLGQFTGCSILEDDGHVFGIANFVDGAIAQRAISTLASTYRLEAGLSRMASDFIQKQGPARRRTLFVGGLGVDVNEADFEEFFEQFGQIESWGIKRDRETGISKGMGFVCFKDINSAEACKKFSGKRELKGSRPFFSYFKGPMPNPSQYSRKKESESGDSDLKMPTPESLNSKFVPNVEYDESGNIVFPNSHPK